MATSAPVLIAVDWGTSRLRARLLDRAAGVVEAAESDDGIGRIDGGHEQVFERLVGKWPAVPALMAGMVGSRQGWREAAYVPCPAEPEALAKSVMRFTTSRGRDVAIVPGLMLADETRDFDVMRGEETQIAGLIAAEPGFSGLAVLPGTHSKWTALKKGRIETFQTFITGELFELLATKSFLRHSVAEGGGDMAESSDFRIGVERTAKAGLPFLSALFSVRARQLLGNVTRENNLAYLSGLAIGGEIAAARATTALSPATPVRIIANGKLADAYRAALGIVGIAAETRDGDRLALDGLAHIARTLKLLPAVAS